MPAKQLTSRSQHGVTLIELMIVVVILGVIAAFAYPSYTAYVIKTNRAAAMSYMTEIAAKQEEFVLDARRYAGSIASLGISTPSDVAKFYTVTVTAFNASTPVAYSVVATPLSSSMQAADGALTLNSSGEKLPADKWQ